MSQLTTQLRIEAQDTATGFRHRVRYGPSVTTQANVGGGTPGTVTIATSATPVDLSTLVDPAMVYIRNLEPEGGNVVKFGPTGQPWLEFAPGVEGAFPLGPGETLEGIATGGAVKCDIRAFER